MSIIMDIISFLRTTPLSRNLSEDQLQILAQSAREKRCRAGQLIIGERNEIRTFFIVAAGRVKMFKSSSDGKEQTLYLLGPGEMFGMCAAFSDSIFPANAMTLEETTLLILPGTVIEDLAKKDPTVLFNLIFILSGRLKESMSLIESLSLMETPQRVASFLLFSGLKKDCREGEIAELTISQRELSKILGTTPETLSRILKKLAGENIIEVTGRKIRVLDCEALEELATG